MHTSCTVPQTFARTTTYLVGGLLHVSGDCQDEGMSDDDGALLRIVTNASNAFGSAVGAFLGAAVDPATAAVAAMAGTWLGSVGADIARRTLSPRQELRAGELLIQATAALAIKEQVEGLTIRDDGFFDGERSNGEEFAEGVLLAAMDTYEERKLPYLGNLLANVAVMPTIDAGTANYALRIGERLSWAELCILTIFDRPDDYPMPDEPLSGGATDWREYTTKGLLRMMVDMRADALLVYRPKKTERLGLQSFDTNLSAVELTNFGRLVAGLMELGKIPEQELTPFYNQLLYKPPAEDGDTSADAPPVGD